MPLPRQRRPARPKKTGWLRRDRGRAGAACVGLLALLAVGALVQGWVPRPAPPEPIARGDNVSTPGFVLLIPVFGTDCGQRFIDNATWRIWDHRIVDCDTALAEAANGDLRQLTAARVDVIRDGFRRK